MKKYVKSANEGTRSPYEGLRDSSCPYRYVLKHGIGPGTIPKDVKIGKVVDGDYYDQIYIDRPLTSEELQQYDIPPEWEIGRYIKEDTDITPPYDDFDDFDEDPYSRYAELAHKSVLDADGFLNDYTLYKDRETDEYFCMFGDNELYPPDPAYADMEFGTNESEAYAWFESYTGIDSDDTDGPAFWGYDL